MTEEEMKAAAQQDEWDVLVEQDVDVQLMAAALAQTIHKVVKLETQVEYLMREADASVVSVPATEESFVVIPNKTSECVQNLAKEAGI